MKKKLLTIFAIFMCFTLVGYDLKDNVNSVKEDVKPNNNVVPSKEISKYDYVDGKLIQIVDEEGKAKQTDFVIDGLIIVGNRHSYEGLDAESGGLIKKLVENGYKKEGLYSSFYLNEWIEFYIDTKYNGSVNDVKILITPHRKIEELESMSYAQLEDLALSNGGYVIEYQVPDEENYKYVGNGYANMDYSEGKYDILFTYKGKLAYFIVINETKESEE